MARNRGLVGDEGALVLEARLIRLIGGLLDGRGDMKTASSVKTWACRVNLLDGRCPDGCCGYTAARVTSPRTGREVRLDLDAMPASARLRIVEAMMAVKKLPREGGGRLNLTGECWVSLSRQELEGILANEGVCYGS